VSLADFTGQTYAEASRVLAGLGLKPARKDVSDGRPANTVIAQAPPAYTVVASGSTVTLSVSTGKVSVPSVVGKKVAEAQAALNSAGWGNVTVSPTPMQTSDPAKDGTVAAQNPVAGSPFPQSQQITLVVYRFVAPPPTCVSTTPAPPSSAASAPPGASAHATSASSSPGGLPPC
jgi:eukaryotic-like serine/threonine-protein kinase